MPRSAVAHRVNVSPLLKIQQMRYLQWSNICEWHLLNTFDYLSDGEQVCAPDDWSNICWTFLSVRLYATESDCVHGSYGLLYLKFKGFF